MTELSLRPVVAPNSPSGLKGAEAAEVGGGEASQTGWIHALCLSNKPFCFCPIMQMKLITK